jgi:hypothetical protein
VAGHGTPVEVAPGAAAFVPADTGPITLAGVGQAFVATVPRWSGAADRRGGSRPKDFRGPAVPRRSGAAERRGGSRPEAFAGLPVVDFTTRAADHPNRPMAWELRIADDNDELRAFADLLERFLGTVPPPSTHSRFGSLLVPPPPVAVRTQPSDPPILDLWCSLCWCDEAFVPNHNSKIGEGRCHRDAFATTTTPRSAG